MRRAPPGLPERRPYDTWKLGQFVNTPVTPAVRPKLTRVQRERLAETRRAAAKLSILKWKEEQAQFGESWYNDRRNFLLHPPGHRPAPARIGARALNGAGGGGRGRAGVGLKGSASTPSLS